MKLNHKRLLALTIAIWIAASISDTHSIAGQSLAFTLGVSVGKIVTAFVIALVIEFLISRFSVKKHPSKKK